MKWLLKGLNAMPNIDIFTFLVFSPVQTAKRKRGYVKNKLSLKKGKKLTKKSL